MALGCWAQKTLLLVRLLGPLLPKETERVNQGSGLGDSKLGSHDLSTISIVSLTTI